MSEPDAGVYFDYEFTLVRCDGDANSDELIDVNDISYVLFRLAGDPCDGGDANFDGAVDVNDISYVLFRLGNSCGGAMAMMGGPGATITGQDVIEEMGFRNFRQFERFISTLGSDAETIVPPMVEAAIQTLTD